MWSKVTDYAFFVIFLRSFACGQKIAYPSRVGEKILGGNVSY